MTARVCTWMYRMIADTSGATVRCYVIITTNLQPSGKPITPQAIKVVEDFGAAASAHRFKNTRKFTVLLPWALRVGRLAANY